MSLSEFSSQLGGADPISKLAFPRGVAVRQTNADPLELRFPSPSSFQLSMLAGRFVGECLGLDNAEKLLKIAQERRPLYSEIFNVDSWRNETLRLSEKVTFNNRIFGKPEIREYIVSRHEEDEEDPVDDWRGDVLRPKVLLRSTAQSSGELSVELVVSFDDPVPYKNLDLLQDRWRVLSSFLQQEEALEVPSPLTEHFVAHSESDALISCGHTRIKVVPFPTEAPTRVFIEESPRRGIGQEIETTLSTFRELELIFRSLRLPFTRSVIKQIFEVTRHNLPLEQLGNNELTRSTIPIEVSRYQELEVEGALVVFESVTTMAIITKFGDLYVSLRSRSNERPSVVHASFTWDQDSLRFSTNDWNRFRDCFDYEEGDE